MKCDETGLRVDAEEQRGDVAVAGDHFGVAANRVEIQVWKYAAAAPASADRQYRAYRGVGEERVDIRRAILVLPGKISMPVEQVAADLHR